MAVFQITGDSVEKRGPRHPEQVCATCLRGYCKAEIATDKLFVKCPMCPRCVPMRSTRLQVHSLTVKRQGKAVSVAPERSCLSLTFHCLSLTFHCISLNFAAFSR